MHQMRAEKLQELNQAHRSGIAKLLQSRGTTNAKYHALAASFRDQTKELVSLAKMLSDAEAQIDAHKQKADESEKRAAYWRAQYSELHNQVARAETERRSLIEQNKAVETKFRSLKSENDRLKRRTNRLASRIAAETTARGTLAARLETAETNFESVLSSRSWRITSPLRWFMARMPF